MSIRITTSTERPSAESAQLLVAPLFTGSSLPSFLPPGTRRRVAAHLRKIEFKGRWGTAEVLALPGSRPAFIGVLGLGNPRDRLTRQAEGIRRAFAKVVRDARRHLVRSIALDLRALQENTGAIAAAATEAAELTNYHFTDYVPRLQREQATRSLQRLTIVVAKEQLSATRAAIKRAAATLEGVELARHLVNQPAAALLPRSLAKIAQDIARRSPLVRVKIIDRREAEKNGFTAFLAVARGSHEEPYVIHLTYQPPHSQRSVALVGKGITFDSGGLSLKPAEMMETMKIDMAGAAAVLGLFSVLPSLAPSITVHGIIATCENMPSGNAYRPGDVLTAKNGKTIEVLNTDAEGRITLADALSYAVEQKPDAIIDAATLTGACMVALGESIAGLWSNTESLQHQLLVAAEITGEALCALPLPDEYRPYIKSRVADVRNLATSKLGGAITAALFLEEFVNGVPWAHLDIAGPSYMDKLCLPYYDIGATGFGVRLLAEYLKR